MSTFIRKTKTASGATAVQIVTKEGGGDFLLRFVEHRLFGGFEHDVEPAHHGERQNDVPVLVLLVTAAQEIGRPPDETRYRRMVHGSFILVHLLRARSSLRLFTARLSKVRV